MDSSNSKTNENLKRKAESESESDKKQATSDLNKVVDASDVSIDYVILKIKVTISLTEVQFFNSNAVQSY